VHVGGRYHSALDARRGIELPPGSHTVRLRCIADCPEGPTERSADVELGPGELKKLKKL